MPGIHLTGRSVRPPVEERDGVGVLGPVHRHDRPRPDLNPLLLVDSAALNTKRILVDSDDLLVLEDGLVVRLERPQIDGHEEGSCEDGPHGHLGLALLIRQPEVADDQLK